MLVLAQAHIARHDYLPLFLAPMLGRSGCVLLAACAPSHDPKSLGGLVAAGARPRATGAASGFTLIICAFFLPFSTLCAILVGLGLVVLALRHIAREQNGFNGDFLGAAIILIELVTLAATLL